jgi:hypothetical protein
VRARRPSTQLSESIDALHADALQSLDRKDLQAFRRAMDVYGDILLTFPREWARYGETFVPALASDMELLGPSDLDSITSALFEEQREIMKSGAREFMRSSLGLYYRVLAEAVGLRAHALWISVLAQLRGVCRLSTEFEDPVADLAREMAVRYQFEIGRYYVGSLVEDEDADPATRTDALTFIEEWFDELLELLRFAVDQGDAEDVASLNTRWEQVLEYWQPEFEPPTEFDVDALEAELGREAPRTIQARERLASNRGLAARKSALLEKRQAYRAGLLWWAFRNWQGEPGPKRDTFFALLESFPTNAMLIDAITLATRREMGGISPWSRWELFELPEGEAHSVSTDLALLGVLIAVLLLRADSQPISSGELESLGDALDAAAGMLEALTADPRILAAMDVETAQTRANAVREALDQAKAARVAEAAEALRAAPLNEEKVASFRRDTKAGWEETRVLAPMFEHFGKLLEDSDQSVLGETEGWFGRDEFLPKELFTDVRVVSGLDMISHEMGESLTRGEVTRFLRMLSETSQAQVSENEVTRAVDATVREMLELGYRPGVVLIPISWQLERELHVGKFMEPDDATSQENVFFSERRRHWYAGETAGMFVFKSTSVPTDRMFLVDLERWGTLRQWTLDETGEQLAVDVWAFTDESARELLDAHPGIYSDRGSVDLRVGLLLERVRVRIRERFRIELEDENAARFLPLPDDLRGSG